MTKPKEQANLQKASGSGTYCQQITSNEQKHQRENKPMKRDEGWLREKDLLTVKSNR